MSKRGSWPWILANLPPDYPKPRLVVADNMVDVAREFWGDGVEIIAHSDTMLPVDSVPKPSAESKREGT
jgi:hypothetical protein